MTLHALINNQSKQIVEGFIGVNDMPRSIKAIYIGNEENKPVLCFKRQDYNYVSFGDSIAAGHSINDEWAKTYGTGSQYGNRKNSNSPINTETEIVPNCYTDLIYRHLQKTYGTRAKVKSFARSGDRVDDLINILNDPVVINTIKEAHYVTVCIGANDVLEPAMSALGEYINQGQETLEKLKQTVESNLNNLRDNSNSASYMVLFNKLKSINPTAKYVFTTIYNPYKFLYIEEGHQGFFEPVLSVIPNMVWNLDEYIEALLGIEDLGYFKMGDNLLDWYWESLELDVNITNIIKDGLLNAPHVQLLFNRVNGLSAYSEDFVTKLNTVLRNKINEYNDPCFSLIETKNTFDQYPDRPSGVKPCYNDLVNVEFTRGYNTWLMDWDALWRDLDYSEEEDKIYNYWWKLFFAHVTVTFDYNEFLSNPLDGKWLNPFTYFYFDMNEFAKDLVNQIINKVIVPNVDPHPEEAGQRVMSELFIEAIPA